VYDLRGRELKRLVDRFQGPGRYELTWRGTDDKGRRVASGVYLYLLRVYSSSGAEKYRAARKMLLLK